MDKQTFLDKVVFGYIKKDLENMRDKIRPEPYAVGNINFPLALCVLAYMEYLGSFLLGRYVSFSPSVREYISKCFTKHDEYPVEILRDIFRNGLAHEYFARGGISRNGGRPAVYKEVGEVALDAETLVNDFLNSLDKFKEELENVKYTSRLNQAEKSIADSKVRNKNLIDQLPIRFLTSTTPSSGASIYPGSIETTTTSSSKSSSSSSQVTKSDMITRPYESEDMTKRVFLIHGWEGYPEEGWRPWLKQELEKKGFEVVVPTMPDTATPTMDKWVPYLAKTVGIPDENTYFVGHSLGCITILRYLEALKEGQKVGGVILVAGFAHDLEYDGYKGELSSFFQTPVNWEEVKEHCSKFIAIHSDDDPWVPIKHNDIFKEKLGAEALVMHRMKHFSGDDGINELPIALDSVLELADKQ